MLENTITDPPFEMIFELPPDETVEIGGLELKFHHPGFPGRYGPHEVGPNQQLRRSAFLRGALSTE